MAFKISKVVFRDFFQSYSDLKIDLKTINIIVGPNNSGKSTVLKDIENWFEGQDLRLLEQLGISLSQVPSHYQEFQTDILEFEDGDSTGEGNERGVWLYKQHIYHESKVHQHHYSLKEIKDKFTSRNLQYFRDHFFKYYIIRLDGKKRFDAIQSQPFAVFRTSRTGKNYLTRLCLNNEDKKTIDEIIRHSTGWCLVLDRQFQDTGEYINILLSKVQPDDPIRKSKEEIIPISEFGDGIQCIIGICVAALSFPYRIVLLDEPEAYLHPPTAYSLGRYLSKHIEEKQRSLIVSTHSAEFLMGCMQSVPPSDICIIRLTYQNRIGTVNKLKSEDISKFTADPVLRSSEILNALFHNCSIISESWGDKVIYQEVNNKLLQFKRGIYDPLFLNGNGKDSLYKITGPLRKIGVPAAVIYDLDVLKDKVIFEKMLCSTNVGSSDSKCLEIERKFIISEIDMLNLKDVLKDPHAFKIPPHIDRAISELLNKLRVYGIFIVPVGELECWLRYIPYRKPDNPFIKLLNKINIVMPTHDDIWQFIDNINVWISDPNRCGMVI